MSHLNSAVFFTRVKKNVLQQQQIAAQGKSEEFKQISETCIFPNKKSLTVILYDLLEERVIQKPRQEDETHLIMAICLVVSAMVLIPI